MKKTLLFTSILMLFVSCEQVTKQNYATCYFLRNSTEVDVSYGVVTVEDDYFVTPSALLGPETEMILDYVVCDSFVTNRNLLLNPYKCLTDDESPSAVFLAIGDTIYKMDPKAKDGMFYSGNYIEVAEDDVFRREMNRSGIKADHAKIYLFPLTREWLNTQQISSTNGKIPLP